MQHIKVQNPVTTDMLSFPSVTLQYESTVIPSVHGLF